MTTYTITADQLASIKASLLQHLDNGDEAAADALGWVLTAEPSGWRPIETAPKDGTKVMLLCPRFGVCAPGEWDTNEFNKKPKPYWTHWGERIWGVKWIRDDQPTHWQPLPQPPEA